MMKRMFGRSAAEAAAAQIAATAHKSQDFMGGDRAAPAPCVKASVGGIPRNFPGVRQRDSAETLTADNSID